MFYEELMFNFLPILVSIKGSKAILEIRIDFLYDENCQI
jgi:hypothetical protein